MPGWGPLSIGYHGDDGGVYVESGKMNYRINETFKDARIGVSIGEKENWVTFFKDDIWPNLCTIKVEPRILKEDLYPCVGFRFAKDATVIAYSYNDYGEMSLLNKETPNYCPVNN